MTSLHAPAPLLSYFTGKGEGGLHLVYSHDGLRFEALNGGKSILELGE